MNSAVLARSNLPSVNLFQTPYLLKALIDYGQCLITEFEIPVYLAGEAIRTLIEPDYYDSELFDRLHEIVTTVPKAQGKREANFALVIFGKITLETAKQNLWTKFQEKQQLITMYAGQPAPRNGHLALLDVLNDRRESRYIWSLTKHWLDLRGRRFGAGSWKSVA